MNRRLRVGIIGCGAGRLHAACYHQLPNVEIVALSGLESDRCQQIAAQFNIPERYGDYHDLLRHADVEAVSIVLPNWLHAPATIAALQSGRHVLVEKPLACTVAEGEAMVQAAAEADSKLMICFNYRFRGDSQAVKQYVDSGGLGHIYYAKASWLRQAGIPGGRSWFTNREKSGGGPLIDLGVHILDLTLYFMGHPRPVAVTGATYAEFGPRGKGSKGDIRFHAEEDRYDVEDLALAFIRFDTGATLSLETSWASFTSHEDDYSIHLFGSEGGAELNVPCYSQVDTVRFFAEINGSFITIKPEYAERRGHLEAIKAFVQAIIDDTSVPVPGEQGLVVLRLVDAIYRSAESGHEIR
ncbi:MAG TPA: Gfo/Idh/MocA family oxidoreductase, partial [Anaerolineae bacterium]|nr:Gfo/Idh/MocA family oxidoreductase [Anaerolineae bacterium]